MISLKPNDQFRTPVQLFNHYNSIYNFTIDGAASAHDALVKDHDNHPCYWGPGSHTKDYFDTTSMHWDGERVWINPPYSMIPEFLAHHREVGSLAGVTCWLLPAWTDRKWMHEFIWAGGHPKPGVHVDFLPGRPRFLMPDGTPPLDKHGRPQTGKFASMVVVQYGGGVV